jgi:pyrimidine operon attenuation protein/uracil phosphoribosyltransferase
MRGLFTRYNESLFTLRRTMSNSIVEILTADEIRRTIVRLASEIGERCRDLSDVVLVGIQTKGVPLADMLARQIEILEHVRVPVGALDITFYRDDLSSIAVRTPRKTEIPVDLTGKTVILVDDVIFQGRTIRASLNAVTEYGRPKHILLAVLIDRGHRQLPIHPDFVGKKLPTSREEQIKVYFQASDGKDAVELIRAS